MVLSIFVIIASLVRIILGLVTFFNPKLGMHLLGFPSEHDNESARIMSRLFAIRDIGLGILSYASMSLPQSMLFVFLCNIATDTGDLISFFLSMGKNNPCRKAAIKSSFIALTAIVAWSCAIIFLM